jgi:DNA processing protein
MDEKDVILGLHEIEGIGWDTIQQIFDAVEDVRMLLERPASALLAGTTITLRRVRDIETILTKAFIEGKLRFYDECGVVPITFFDTAYPPLLRYIDKPPWVIYTIGNIELLQRDSIAVVGSRHPTPYGREVAEWFGSSLAGAGLPVVSGLARGIDTYAHIGALRATGDTIAVLGNGLNVCYPPEHHKLQRRIGNSGLVVSEYGWNTRPSKGTFPWRNRIIAGLTRGTLVVEAALGSGSLGTSNYANNFGRDVFAIPGLITSPKSAGVYQLLRDGAKLVTSPEDIWTEYGVRTPAVTTGAGATENQEALTPEESELLVLMGAESVTIDELLMRTAYTFGHLHTLLLSLLVKNRIRALPGSAYIVRMN